MINNPKVPAPKNNTEHIKVAREVGELVTELLKVLDEEYALIESSSPERLTALVQQKDTILHTITARGQVLSTLFEQASDNPEVGRLMQQVRQCRDLNERNKSVAHVQLSHTRKSLEMLRSLMNLNDVPVYGATGEITVAREKRDFGSA